MNIKMNDKNKAPFKVEDVNWDELSGIGILKDELEQAGELETLLRGEKTGVRIAEPRTPRCRCGDGCHFAACTQERLSAARNHRYQPHAVTRFHY